MQDKSIEQIIENEVRRKLEAKLDEEKLKFIKSPLNCFGNGVFSGYGKPDVVYKDELICSSIVEFLVSKIKKPIISINSRKNGYYMLIDVVFDKFYTQVLNTEENAGEQESKPTAYIEIKKVLELVQDEEKVEKIFEEYRQRLLENMG